MRDFVDWLSRKGEEDGKNLLELTQTVALITMLDKQDEDIDADSDDASDDIDAGEDADAADTDEGDFDPSEGDTEVEDDDVAEWARVEAITGELAMVEPGSRRPSPSGPEGVPKRTKRSRHVAA